MNERIDQLIEQCTTQQFSDCVGGYETFDKEKFAEMIVRECAEQIVAKGTDCSGCPVNLVFVLST